MEMEMHNAFMEDRLEEREEVGGRNAGMAWAK
jgi:hypothetical protein